MDIDIKSGGKGIIASGVFTTFDDGLSTIILKKGKESFLINLKFSNDESKKLHVDNKSRKDDKTNTVIVDFELFNFNSPLGSSLTEPMQIGHFDNGDNIFLHLTIRKLGNDLKSHEVTYTFYMEKKQDGKHK